MGRLGTIGTNWMAVEGPVWCKARHFPTSTPIASAPQRTGWNQESSRASLCAKDANEEANEEANMKAELKAAALFAILISSIGLSAIRADAAPINPHPAVARVRAAEGEGASFGTGTLIGKSDKHGLVITNWHVIRDAKGPVTVHFPDGFASKATILMTDETWDLAALLVWPPKADPVPLAVAKPARGETASIAGYGNGSYRTAAGRVVNFVSPGERHPFDFMEVDVAARNGDSGGPIFNAKGELAGVLFGSARGRTDGSHALRVGWFVRRVLDRYEKVRGAMRFEGQLAAVSNETPVGTGSGTAEGVQPG